MIAEGIIKIKSATTMAGCRREPQAESGHGVAHSRSPGYRCHSPGVHNQQVPAATYS